MKRKWSMWPGRIRDELNGTNGIAGAGGLAISAAGATVFSGLMATALTGVGSVLALGAVGYALYRSTPPKLRSAEDLVGDTVTLDELAVIYPPIPKLAIIGVGQAGKTTLRDRLSFDVSRDERTQQITAKIVALVTRPPRYLAILDGGGEKYAQQFKIAEVADCICIVADHNVSDTSKSLSKTRVAQHRKFLGQVKHHLEESHSKKKNWTRILLNKHDLWRLASAPEQAELGRFVNQESEKWRVANLSHKVDFVHHSNANGRDVAKFMAYLKSQG